MASKRSLVDAVAKKNNERMAALIASELRASDESDDEAIRQVSKPKAKRAKSSKSQSHGATLKTGNPFNPLPVEEASDADDDDYDDNLPLLLSTEDDSDVEEITNKEVCSKLNC